MPWRGPYEGSPRTKEREREAGRERGKLWPLLGVEVLHSTRHEGLHQCF
jgi:hypothetical protein